MSLKEINEERSAVLQNQRAIILKRIDEELGKKPEERGFISIAKSLVSNYMDCLNEYPDHIMQKLKEGLLESSDQVCSKVLDVFREKNEELKPGIELISGSPCIKRLPFLFSAERWIARPSGFIRKRTAQEVADQQKARRDARRKEAEVRGRNADKIAEALEKAELEPPLNKFFTKHEAKIRALAPFDLDEALRKGSLVEVMNDFVNQLEVGGLKKLFSIIPNDVLLDKDNGLMETFMRVSSPRSLTMFFGVRDSVLIEEENFLEWYRKKFHRDIAGKSDPLNQRVLTPYVG